MTRSPLRRRIAVISYRSLDWARHRVAPGIRSVLGVLLMVGGVLGFLPVLGFWMFPLGVGFVALDLPATRPRVDLWMARLAHQAGIAAGAASGMGATASVGATADVSEGQRAGER